MTGSTRDKRLWLGGGVAVLALILLAAWLLLIGPELAQTRDLRDQAATVRSEGSVLAAGTATLKQKYAHLPDLEADTAAALAALPPTGGMPQLSRQLSRQAEENGVVLDSIQVAASAPVTPPAGTSTTGTPATTPPTTGTSTAGTVATPVTLLSRGSAAQQRRFLQAIQLDGPRRALVTSTSLTATSKADVEHRSSMTTQITVFSAPLSEAQRSQLDKLVHGEKSD